MADSNFAKGALFLTASACSFAVMGLFVRLSGPIPFIEKTFFRNLIALLIAGIALGRQIRRNGPPAILPPKDAAPYLLLRLTAGTAGIFGNFYAIDHLILSDAALLNKISPFFALLFSFILLGERLNRTAIICITAAFAGSLLVIKPGLHFQSLLPALAGLCGGIGAGLAHASVRKLRVLGCNGAVIVFLFSAFSLLCAAPYQILHFAPFTPRQFIFMLGIGAAAAGGQFGMTAAYYNAPASKISIFDFSQIIFSALLGFLFFGQTPDLLSIAGYAVIIAAAAVNLIYNQAVQKNA